jgi:D-alanine--poly(phosphoribitol) ligase subunit 2
MKLNLDNILDVIYGCVDLLNRQLPHDMKLQKSTDTQLGGEGGVLDSLGLITLLVALEEELEKKFGVQCVLLDEEVMSDQNGPYSSIDSLSKWIIAKMER